jgi:hypothetical protein
MKWFIPIVLMMFFGAYPWGYWVARMQVAYELPDWAGLYIVAMPWVLLGLAAIIVSWREEENYRKKRNKEK